jgi:hypothetical protein
MRSPDAGEPHWKRYDRMERDAVDRLDVLEDVVMCQVEGCHRGEPLFAFSGIGDRTFHVCLRHRPLYRTHAEILRRIDAIS